VDNRADTKRAKWGAHQVRNTRIILAAAAAAMTSAPAWAVTPDKQATGKGLILVPLTLTKLDDLDFGTLVPSSVSGFVSINAATGARNIGGGVTGVPSAQGKRARFAGAGTGGQTVIITINPATQLVSTTNSADTIPVLALTLEGSPIKTIDPVTRSVFFGVGGVIQINSNQAEGLYTATFDVTANYL
jgi:hypothetical protein